MSCDYCKNITVCAICGKGYAEAMRSSTRVTIAPMGMSFDAEGKLQQGESGTRTPPAAEADEFTNGVNAAAAMLDKMADDYADEHGMQDPDTGVTEFKRGAKEDYYNTLRELADDIRSIVHGNTGAALAGVTACDCAARLAGRVDGNVHFEGCPNFVAPTADVERLINDLSVARYQLGRAAVKLENDPYNEGAEEDHAKALAAAASARDALLAHVRGVTVPAHQKTPERDQ